MASATAHSDVEERIERLERSVKEFDTRLRRAEAGLGPALVRKAVTSFPPPELQPRVEQSRRAEQRVGVEHPPAQPQPRVEAPPPPPSRPPRAFPSGMSLSDFVGGRGLAWLGGIAILAGTILFLALAISHGWIGREARVVLAALGSAGLVAGGAWLHARRGRTEAAVAMVGAGTAGWFATAAVAGQVYALVPPLVAVAASILAGAVATMLAIRWAGRAIGALGLVGALLSPVLVGAPQTAPTLALLGVAGVCAMWVVVWQRWSWLALATVLISAPQWGGWVLDGHAALADALVLAGFAALALAGAVGIQIRAANDRVLAAAGALLVLNAFIAGTVGRVALLDAAGPAVSALWLVGLAVVYGAIGLLHSRRIPVARPLRQASLAIGVVLADVAFGLSASGLVLVAGWAAAALVFAWLIRRTDTESSDAVLLSVGIGAHIGLVLLRTLLDAPPSDLTGGGVPELTQLVTVAVLAASCLASGWLTGDRQHVLRASLNALGLGAVAYLTAGALDGAALVAAWAAEGVVLERIARRTEDSVAWIGAAGFICAAIAYTLATAAPPTGLVTGVSSLPLAAIELALVAGTFLVLAATRQPDSRHRQWLVGAAGVTLLYLASIAIVTTFQPTDGTFDMVLDLSVRQQGQVLLSAMWSLIGLAVLIVGLRRGFAPVRNGALALLLLSVGKVFLYDLSTLTSIYRVISFIVLGMLLLAAAFAYQRLRPPPSPDLRTLHPSQR